MFHDILVNLMTRVKGAQWAMVVGVDGVLLEASPGPNVSDREALAAEYTMFFRSAQRVTADTKTGELRSSTLFTSRGKVLFQFLTPEYFLLMGLDLHGHTGMARFEITRTQGLLQRELVS